MMNRRLKAHEKGVGYLQERIAKKIRVVDIVNPLVEQHPYTFGSDIKKETLEACLILKSKYFSTEKVRNELEAISKPVGLELIRKSG